MRKHLSRLLIGLLAFSSAHAGDLVDIVTKGSVDRSVPLTIIDSTDGTNENAVVFNTSGIDLWYRREGAARVAVTEVTLAALTTAHTDGGFLYVSDGEYRLDLPDAAFATGANHVDYGGTVTGMIVKGGRVRLVDYSLEDAVRGTAGTALPNAVAGASNGVLISGTNSGTTTLGALTVTGVTTHTGATTYTGAVTMANGLAITQATTNGHGITATGNGTGAGLRVVAGATGTGLNAVGGSTSGAGVTVTATSGNGITTTGGGTGHGLAATSGSGATGNGITALAASTNGNGMASTGTGTGAGEVRTAGATGSGSLLVGGSTSGNALSTTVTAPIGAVKGEGITESGTLQSATGTTAVLRSATNFPDTTLVGSTLVITGGTGVGQSRTISAWTSTSDTATVATWTTTPDSTSTYEVWGTSASSGGGGGGGDATAANQTLILAAIDAVDNYVDTEIAALTTNLATANTNILVVDDYVDTEVAAILTDTGTTLDALIQAIKAKTDQLTFGVTNTLNVNTEYMNAEPVCGTGDAGTLWTGCP